MMHQSEFDAANVALSRAADKRKSLINIHKNRYTATLRSVKEKKRGDQIVIVDDKKVQRQTLPSTSARSVSAGFR